MSRTAGGVLGVGSFCLSAAGAAAAGSAGVVADGVVALEVDFEGEELESDSEPLPEPVPEPLKSLSLSSMRLGTPERLASFSLVIVDGFWAAGRGMFVRKKDWTSSRNIASTFMGVLKPWKLVASLPALLGAVTPDLAPRECMRASLYVEPP